MINEAEYERLYKQIKSKRDIERLAKKGWKPDFLLELLTMKLARETRRRFYRLPRDKILMEWRAGKTATKLAAKYGISPVMMLYTILLAQGYSKKKARAMINGKVDVRGRIKKELEEARKEDVVYSPSGLEIQLKKGKEGEERIKRFLEKRGIKFLREVDLKKEYSKTPDFLLAKIIMMNNEPVRWIESKASIGDLEKVKRDYTKQLKQYMEMFGPGAIVYWFGVLPSAKRWLEDKGVLVLESLRGVRIE